MKELKISERSLGVLQQARSVLFDVECRTEPDTLLHDDAKKLNEALNDIYQILLRYVVDSPEDSTKTKDELKIARLLKIIERQRNQVKNYKKDYRPKWAVGDL